MKIAIIVYHREGKSILAYLRRNPHLYPGAEITVVDENPRVRVPRGVHKKTGADYLKNLSGFDIIFRSPGISYNHSEFVAARRAGAKFSSSTKLFFTEALRRLARSHIIAVTGSKGKSTTATLIYEFLKAAGKQVLFAGNIGKPALSILPKLNKDSFVVLELSSFQLEDMDISPGIAVLTELFPEHQDVHGSVKNYYEAKSNIARHQEKSDVIFYLGENKTTARVARLSRGKKIAVGSHDPAPFLAGDIKLKGRHQYMNAVLAARAAQYVGVPPATILNTVKKFKGLAHRMEFVGKKNRVEFYDDSASTNPTSTIAAIRTFKDTPHVLIAGGVEKDLPYRALARSMKKYKTIGAVLFGRDKKKIGHELEKADVPVRYTKTLEEAVHMAYKTAAPHAPSAVLFSPATMSFDMFQNYAHRGREFKKEVGKLPK